MRFGWSICFIFFSLITYANVINVETDNFQHIAKIYHESVDATDHSLLVFDIDDTLLTMTQPLGSVGWWDWQYDLLQHDTDSPYLFSKSLVGLLRIQNILFQLVKMEVTDPDVIPFIKDEAGKGAILLGLTARDDEHENATENELSTNGFMDQNELIFKRDGVKLFNQKTSSSGDIKCKALGRMITYIHGIMYLGGQDKGEALRCVLEHTKTAFNKILFVDDSLSNHESMINAFEHDKTHKVINVLFTREHPKETQFLHDPEQQHKAYDRWTNIKSALHHNIEDPIF